MRIPLASSGLRQKDIDQLNIVLNSGKLTMGEEVKKFENLMAEYLGVNHFVMMNSGSSANLAMLEALMRPTKSSPILAPGDGVLVPAIAWPTTIWPLVQLGLKPIFVDVDFENVGFGSSSENTEYPQRFCKSHISNSSTWLHNFASRATNF